MRILLLTILFISATYYYTQDEQTTTSQPSIDSIKVKMGAPHRINNDERSPANKIPTFKVAEVAPKELEEEDFHHLEEDPRIALAANLDMEHVEQIKINDIEMGWNNELKDFLDRLEPFDSEDIHRAYLTEQEFYQSELDSLLNEKQQQQSPENSLEIEYLISQLDQNHQYKLQEILGAHYEAVRDHYQYYMDTAAANQ